MVARRKMRSAGINRVWNLSLRSGVCVAISHLWGGMIGGPAAYAVWGFYCLSGYLMTLVLNEKYGFSPRGLARFAINRALRIYPAYYVVCTGMFLLFYFIPDTSARFLPNLQMPRTGQGWRVFAFANVLGRMATNFCTGLRRFGWNCGFMSQSLWASGETDGSPRPGLSLALRTLSGCLPTEHRSPNVMCSYQPAHSPLAWGVWCTMSAIDCP